MGVSHIFLTLRKILRKLTTSPYIALLRVKEYIKNIIVFAPIFFAAKALELPLVLNTLFVFVAFCMIASSVYILNDMVDIDYDLQHALKKNRPLASGSISKQKASIIGAVLFLAAISLGFFIKKEVGYILLTYFGINILYTVWLKQIALVDIFAISSGFILRLFSGSLATGIVLSDWIILLTVLLSIFLILGKRRQDILLLKHENEISRKSLKHYSEEYINAVMILIASVIIALYIMYSISSDMVRITHDDYFKLTSLWIIVAFMRYFQLIFVMKKSKSPIYLFFEDPFLIVVVLLWILHCFYLIY